VSPPEKRARPDATRDRVETELVGPLAALDLDVEAVELTPSGKRRVLRVAVDKDGGVTLDDVAEATRLISGVLDAGDALGEQPYTLEVTSRGVDRPLTLPRHWRRNRDRLVTCSLTGGERLTGRIRESTDTTVTLDVEGRRRELAYAEIGRALVQIEFNPRRTEPGRNEEGS
jgi:ribosome maturation factor RimP